jgi:hypothetical protein
MKSGSNPVPGAKSFCSSIVVWLAATTSCRRYPYCPTSHPAAWVRPRFDYAELIFRQPAGLKSGHTIQRHLGSAEFQAHHSASHHP